MNVITKVTIYMAMTKKQIKTFDLVEKSSKTKFYSSQNKSNGWEGKTYVARRIRTCVGDNASNFLGI
uniref:Phage protein n=1 Tax=Strongyloides venezuelensis TaxID=75913 RepID=A0A0K0FHA8_STRVS